MTPRPSDREPSTADPAALAQSLFARFEGKGEPDGPAAATSGAASPGRDELLNVVRNLEQVTASLIATSTALATIARSLAAEPPR